MPTKTITSNGMNGSQLARQLAKLGRGVKKTMSEAAMNQRRSAAKISAKKRAAKRQKKSS